MVSAEWRSRRPRLPFASLLQLFFHHATASLKELFPERRQIHARSPVPLTQLGCGVDFPPNDKLFDLDGHETQLVLWA